ncbi:MAG TPA: family 20 glycosylhydrolase, partial [Puia sp.]|nr:family 20 glycosylhydrolase [Puia sp.]
MHKFSAAAIRSFLLFIFPVLGVFQSKATDPIPHPAAEPPLHLIPQPVSVKQQSGTFILDRATLLSVENASFSQPAAWFLDQLKTSTGIGMKQGKGSKVLQISNMPDRNILGKEGYTLSITPSRIRLQANDPAGVFYGLQTLLQLLPADFAARSATGGTAATSGTSKAAIPCADITDYPRFGWRGLMLDVSRHFFTKQEVERYIDEMVRYKYNTLHLHLSDDQGWRIEIKSLPRLTQHGAWRVSRTGRWGEFLPS